MSELVVKKTRRNKTPKSKKPKVKLYYPKEKIGEGAYKEVFNVTSNLDAANIKEDVLTRKERESMGVILDERTSNNVVMIRPNMELPKDGLDAFVKEMSLQQKFSDLGFAPKVLKVNTELKNKDGYTPYAYTYRCNFNMCDYEFKNIAGDLKKLFDGIANAGYIYTEIKQAKM